MELSEEQQTRLKQIRELQIVRLESHKSALEKGMHDEIYFLLSLLDSDSQAAETNDDKRATALAAREDWRRFDWDGAKPYKEHLRESLKTVDDYRGYLDACHAEGPETFALAVQDVAEFVAIRMRDLCLAKLTTLAHKYRDGANKAAWKALLSAATELESLTLER